MENLIKGLFFQYIFLSSFLRILKSNIPLDLEIIKNHYRSLSDTKIKDIAKFEARALRPEVIPVLKQEIINRKLPEELLDFLDRKLLRPTELEIINYCKIIQKQRCPSCYKRSTNLNATNYKYVISFLFGCVYRVKFKIACTDCLNKQVRNASAKTFILGWWSFYGFIHTIDSLIFNFRMFSKHHHNIPNKMLKDFVSKNISIIEACKESELRMQDFLKNPDNKARQLSINTEEYYDR